MIQTVAVRLRTWLSLFLLLGLCLSCTHKIPSPTRFGTDKYTGEKNNAIHYVEIGDGPPVIMIPGLFGTYRGWNRIIPFLATKYRLLAIDNFGTAESGRSAEDFTYSVAEQADVIVAMMDELKLHTCNLVGVSYGGMIALNLAARYPERVGSVTAIEGAVIMPKNQHYRMLELGLGTPAIGSAIMSFLKTGLFDETITKDIMGSAWATMGLEERAEITGIISDNVKSASRDSWLRLARALNTAEDFSEIAKHITAPVLYLAGGQSSFREMTSNNITFFRQHLPKVQIFIFADGIHDLQLQKPKETAEMIDTFFDGYSGHTIDSKPQANDLAVIEQGAEMASSSALQK